MSFGGLTGALTSIFNDQQSNEIANAQQQAAASEQANDMQTFEAIQKMQEDSIQAYEKNITDTTHQEAQNAEQA